MDERLDYRIGLDIGIASVGWAVLQNNSQGEPVHIVDLGVRIFDKAEQPKTGESLAAPRRDARTTRRRLRRRKHRMDRIKYLFSQEGLIEIEPFMERYYSGKLKDVYQLRYEALDRKLKDEELAQVLLHIAKHRGFRSTRKAELAEDKEGGQVLKATNENKKRMEDHGYRTVGEMMYLDEDFRAACSWVERGYVLTPRNKAGNYRHTILRAMLVEEVHAIFVAQRELGNEKATEGLEEKYLEIMESQRSFDMGPGKQPDGTPSPYAISGFEGRVGKCTFEKEELRAAKGTYTAEYFVALQKISHTKLVNTDGEVRNFTEEERQILVELLHSQKEIKYAAVRKKLNLGVDIRFYNLNYRGKKAKDTEKPLDVEEVIKETEKAKFIGMPWYHEYKKVLEARLLGMQEEEKKDLLDEVGKILSCLKNDDSRTERLAELGLSGEEIKGLLPLNPAKFQHLSVKAMRNMLPYLEQGMTYDKACAAAGYDFKADDNSAKQKLLQGERVNEVLSDITNPVVRRSVSQTIKVINAIIRKYGSPQAVHIELAREMAKNFDERKKLENAMKERGDSNEKAKKRIQELGVLSPNGQDILKYRLWVEQDGRCMYSGKVIPLEKLFKPGYEIDHILPYSITFDDSFRNKVLVEARENQQKGNRTPFEYFGSDEEKWKEFEARVNTIRDFKKRDKFLKKHFTEEERKEFKERNLNDTKYITTVVYNLIRQNLELASLSVEGKKKQVRAVNGAVTAYLRKRWGLPQKNRETDTHHAMDAVVIACCTDGMIQKISRYTKGRELRYARGYRYVDEETGEIFDCREMDKDAWDERFGVKVPLPWNSFKKELDVRMGADPKNFLDTHMDVATEIDYPEFIYEKIRPIFVSRMPNHKVTGAAHADTIRSPRHFSEDGVVLTKTALTDLKLNKDGEIEGYYNKESDWLLYNALKRQLELYGGDGKKAFAEDFHKPKADGTEGPVVRKVKIAKKQTSGVLVNGGEGIAENGSMVRIDVFRKDGKYYFVPIYTADVVKKVLPNRAATAGKSCDEWRVMEDKDFVFSLYSRDLVHIKSKKDIPLKLVAGGKDGKKDIYVYYIKANIALGSIIGIAHDNSYKFENLGIQSLELLEKCQVDVLGNVSVVKQEKRMGFS